MVTHLWEAGYASEDKNALMGYSIVILGADREVSFREDFNGTDVNEVKLRAMDFIINHHKLKTNPMASFKKGDLFSININGVDKHFVIEPTETEYNTPMIIGVSVDGADSLEIKHGKKINPCT